MNHNYNFISSLKRKLCLLDPQRAGFAPRYQELRYCFIKYNEGLRTTAYFDTTRNITVGVGFNMDDQSSRTEWERIFKGSIDFDKVYRREVSLSASAIRSLFDMSINKREQELIKIYSSIWHQLKPNEWLAIEDAYFNAPALVRGGSCPTHFWSFIHKYIKHVDSTYLQLAVKELLCHSNPRKCIGIGQRRYRQALMLCSNAEELAHFTAVG